MKTNKSDTSISIRLSRELEEIVIEAAAALGQTVGEYIISTVVREARQVLQHTESTLLSNRDRDAFLAALDDADAVPNSALKAAAQRYKS